MFENRPQEGERPRPAIERLLLGDSIRLLVIPFLVVVLALMLHDYGTMVAATNPSLDAFRRNPRQFVGGTFTVSFGRVAEVREGALRLRRDEAEIDVMIENVDVPVGAILSVRGLIRPDLRLAAQDLRIHRGRRLKWLLGGLVSFLTLIVAAREARLDA